MFYDYLARALGLALLFFIFACPICAAIVAGTKNRDTLLWGLIGLIFGPFGLIAAAGAPTVESLEKRRARRGRSNIMALCQFCLEPVRRDASVCRHCTSVLIEDANAA